MRTEGQALRLALHFISVCPLSHMAVTLISQSDVKAPRQFQEKVRNCGLREMRWQLGVPFEKGDWRSRNPTADGPSDPDGRLLRAPDTTGAMILDVLYSVVWSLLHSPRDARCRGAHRRRRPALLLAARPFGHRLEADEPSHRAAPAPARRPARDAIGRALSAAQNHLCATSAGTSPLGVSSDRVADEPDR